MWQAARKVRADYLITRNAADFARSDVPVLSPAAFFDQMEKDRGLVYEEVPF